MTSPYLGEIRLLTWGWAPRGWAECDGSLLQVRQNTALFALLGTYYGGDGVTTFGLPDLRGRVPLGQGNLSAIGTRAGAETVTLSISTMPSHTHLLTANTGTATIGNASNTLYATDANAGADFYAAPSAQLTTIDPATITIDGSGVPHANIQPYLTLNYVIATTGIFPARN